MRALTTESHFVSCNRRRAHFVSYGPSDPHFVSCVSFSQLSPIFLLY